MFVQHGAQSAPIAIRHGVNGVLVPHKLDQRDTTCNVSQTRSSCQTVIECLQACEQTYACVTHVCVPVGSFLSLKCIASSSIADIFLPHSASLRQIDPHIAVVGVCAKQ